MITDSFNTAPDLQLIRLLTDGTPQLSPDMHNYTNGMYLLRYADNAQTYTLRIVKQ
ncbi:MAG: hypothetical protein JSS82_09450 [Bacteroidetes bacterium]|nr:hypothetical protein [Bacteroidota bacterium]